MTQLLAMLPPGYLVVQTLPNARIVVNGCATSSRRFVSPPLTPGKNYFYTVRAAWNDGSNGTEEVREERIQVLPGKETVLDLRPGAKPRPKLSIHYVPTPQELVDKMLDMAKVTKDDVVYDLGCGDGRIVVTAAKKYGCHAVGIDLDPDRVKESLENVRKAGVGESVEIREADALKVTDLSKATVVTLYLLPDLNLKLRPQLQKELKPGSRIVSHDFDMGDWKSDAIESLNCNDAIRRIIELWTI